MEIIDQKILHDSVRWPLSPLYEVRALPGEITKEESAAGDIVIANEDGIKKIIKQSKYTDNSALYTENGYQPIAVVVVPASHTDDGTARCMALEFVKNSYDADALNITTGTDNVSSTMLFGSSSSVDYDYFSDGKIYPTELELVRYNGAFNYRVYGTTTISSSDMFGSPAQGGTGSPYTGPDPIATSNHYVPAESPYGEDGVSKNPDVFVEGGIVDYMDGYGNTQKIVAHVVNTYVAYDPNNANNRQYSNFMLPATWNAHLYHTIGTKAGSGSTMGDWYLPAAGEIFYLPSRSEDIANGIKLARGFNTYDGVAGAISCDSTTTTTPIYSSTAREYNNDGEIWQIYVENITSGHYVYIAGTSTGLNVIPFIKI